MKRRPAGLILPLLLVAALARAHAPAQALETREPESPRLLALKGAVEAGRVEAIEEFWREVARAGAPLVEPPDEESPESGEYVSSYLELPGAPPQPCVRERPGVKKGRVGLIRYGAAGGRAASGSTRRRATAPRVAPTGCSSSSTAGSTRASSRRRPFSTT